MKGKRLLSVALAVGITATGMPAFGGGKNVCTGTGQRQFHI